jgi:hypothetical protein
VVRWSYVPSAKPVEVSAEELAKRGPNFLDADIFEMMVPSFGSHGTAEKR